ncbi:DUF4411 family protein [Paratractidigestivibacter sp.]|uniref:DUF4411 family protein n=1 Tax=Paratractidigestivibacter sp. TaxID=2847316 RepID=UPI002AC92C57|nr:DUF4411 family protein [Paratractidigestivibacter sp.]
MSSPETMILDTNIFIEAKNRFYAFDICPGFWEFIEDDFMNRRSLSVRQVRDELLFGDDDLSEWVKTTLNKAYFHDCLADEKVSEAQLRVYEFVSNADYKPNAVQDFFGDTVADSWLAAFALTYGGTVVTQEVHKARKVSLYDVCDHFGIHHIDVFDYLRAQQARFYYRKSA